METVRVEVIAALEAQLAELCRSAPKLRKLFDKQKRMMELYSQYPSLGRKKLQNVRDQHGNPLEEVRLDSYWRIVFITRDEGRRAVWLRICKHDEIERRRELFIDGHPDTERDPLPDQSS